MGVRRRPAARAVSAAIALLLSSAFVGCASDDALPLPVAAQINGQAPAADGSTPAPLVVPSWLPDELPLPVSAQVTGVRATQCAVSFLAPGTQAEDMSGVLAPRARAVGLPVRVVASVSSTPPPVTELDGLFVDEVEVEAPITHAVVLEFGDAVLTLTSSGDGVVLGAYQLPGDTCSV